jgi:hypothetical protein
LSKPVQPVQPVHSFPYPMYIMQIQRLNGETPGLIGHPGHLPKAIELLVHAKLGKPVNPVNGVKLDGFLLRRTT